MKKLLFLVFFLINTLNGYSLVFVHIGEQLPAYMEDCIKQARLFNTSCDMYLIGNEKALQSFESQLNELHIVPITIESLPKTAKHQDFLRKTAHEPGFWRYASERFLLIDDFMRVYDMTDIFHIENDVMVYVDLAELLPVLHKKYQGIAAVFDSDLRCIPSFIFIPNTSLMGQLADHFVLQTKYQKNDMEIIALFRNAVSAKIIDGLPIIMKQYIKQYGLKNQLGQKPKNPLKFAHNIEHFKSLFDAAALGQYLGGTFFADKGPGFINETCVFDVSKLKYEWRVDEQGREIPYALFADSAYRINNLHIHSKRLHEFKSR